MASYLLDCERRELLRFHQDNVLEDDRNHQGVGPKIYRTKSFELDPKVSEALVIADKLDMKGFISEDDLVKIASLPEPEVPGSKFNQPTRRQVSDFMLGLVIRIRGDHHEPGYSAG
jgi:hypothetical protein